DRGIKLVGFGAARIPDSSGREEDAALTVAGLAHPAPAYAAPEALVRIGVDGRADIWSVGVILYELLTGGRPFTGSLEDILKATLTTSPPSLRLSNPDIAVGLEEVVTRCLSGRPEGRYEDVVALAAALAPFGSAAGGAAAARVAGMSDSTIPHVVLQL